jgi:hypothetical protein
MAVATLHPSSDGSRFEIHSQHSSATKFIVKSSHRGEIARWIQALKLNIEYHSQREHTLQKPLHSPEKRALSFSSTAPSLGKIQTAVAPELPADRFLSPSLQKSATALTSVGMARQGSSPGGSVVGTDGGDALSIFEAADQGSMLGGGDDGQLAAGVPYEAEFDMSLLNIKAQLDMTEQLVNSIAGSSTPSAPSGQQAIKDALQQSLKTLSVLISQQNIMSKDRERYYVGRIQREVEARKLWEENMLTVARQQAETDEQLHQAARVNEKRRKALRQAKGVLAGLGAGASLPGTPAFETPKKTAADLDTALKTPPSGTFSPATGTSMSHMQEIQQAQEAVAAADSDSDEEEDEFFDAIESNNITNLSMHESIANPDKDRAGTPRTGNMAEKQLTAPKPGSKKITDLLARESLQPYLHVRTRLPIDDDKRPSVSCM